MYCDDSCSKGFIFLELSIDVEQPNSHGLLFHLYIAGSIPFFVCTSKCLSVKTDIYSTIQYVDFPLHCCATVGWVSERASGL